MCEDEREDQRRDTHRRQTGPDGYPDGDRRLICRTPAARFNLARLSRTRCGRPKKSRLPEADLGSLRTGEPPKKPGSAYGD